jgi:hypothetical protein
MRLLTVLGLAGSLVGCGPVDTIEYSTGNTIPWNEKATPITIVNHDEACSNIDIQKAINFWNSKLEKEVFAIEIKNVNGVESKPHWATVEIIGSNNINAMAQLSDVRVTELINIIDVEHSKGMELADGTYVKHYSLIEVNTIEYFCDEKVIAHELGHVLGISHNNKIGDVMCFNYDCMGL